MTDKTTKLCRKISEEQYQELGPTSPAPSATIHTGNCLDVLPMIEPGSVDCCVTSPPYWGLRDYGHTEQIGLEETPETYVEKMVSVFREVRRVLKDDGTLWLNLGDSYAGSGRGGNPSDSEHQKQATNRGSRSFFHDSLVENGHIGRFWVKPPPGRKPKDLVGIPWLVAFALQADGWWLRQDIIWHKPNPMPESVTDRCTKAHEYIFLLSKSARYYYDNEAIAEPVTQTTIDRLGQPTIADQAGSDRVPGKTNGRMKAAPPRFGGSKYGDNDAEEHRTKSGNEYDVKDGRRNKRSVWTVTTKPYKGAHFATFPPDLIDPCILAGSREGGTVLDPFNGSGTTGEVALKRGRNYVGIELNPEYVRLTTDRLGLDIFSKVNAT